MRPEAFRLFRALSGGSPLNARRYAEKVGVSHSEVRKQVEELRRAGLPVEVVRAGDYCLGWPVRLLDADEIHKAADSPDVTVDIVDGTESTNRDLTEHFVHRRVRAAEFQTCGRGRRGRGWISPPGCGVYLSFGFKFESGLPRLGSLSLVAGLVAAEVVVDEGVRAALKWPNDLVVDDTKLGGLLVEIRGASDGPCEVVAGVGINVRLPRDETGSCRFIAPDQPWTDIHTAAAGCHDLDRNRIIGRLTGALDAAFAQFERHGFEPFMVRWSALDTLEGRNVRVEFGTGSVLEGVAAGVDGHGQLRVKTSQGIRSVNAGEVSVRAH